MPAPITRSLPLVPCAAALLVLAAGAAAAQTLERINPPGLSTPTSYSHIVKVGKIVYIAGQIGAKADGTLAGPTMKDQVAQVMANLATALTSQGLDFSHVAKINIFVTSISEFRAPDVVAIREQYFGKNKPVSTLVQIQQLASPEYKVEIEAVAAMP